MFNGTEGKAMSLMSLMVRNLLKQSGAKECVVPDEAVQIEFAQLVQRLANTNCELRRMTTPDQVVNGKKVPGFVGYYVTEKGNPKLAG